MSSFVEQHGLWSDEDRDAATALLAQVEKSGVEVVRISFVDQHGLLRGKTLMVGELEAVLKNGVTMTSSLLLKDTSHITVFPIWQDDIGFGPGQLTGACDVLMIPDLSTFHVLPWSPQNGWLLADLYMTDGRPVPVCSRAILRNALDRLDAKGIDFVSGLEVEFHVLKITDPRLALDDAGQQGVLPETELMSRGYQYLSEQRYDELEPVFDLVRENCVALGLPIRSLEVEFGPSQIEITFSPATGMAHADNMV